MAFVHLMELCHMNDVLVRGRVRRL